MRKYEHALEMVFTRQKAIVVADKYSPARSHPGTNTREGRNPRRPVFTREHNGLFIQRVLQYSQRNEKDELHYHVLGLNESSAEDNIKNPIVTWLFDFTLTKISIHKLLK